MNPTQRIYNGIKFKKKGSSMLMCILAFFLKPFSPDFMTNYWTTLFTTIYVPDSTILDDNFFEDHKIIITHESRHINDFKKFHILFILTYLLPPIFSYGRFVWERRAIIDEIEFMTKTMPEVLKQDYTKRRISAAAEVLSSSNYLWAWPKSWIEKWFHKKLIKSF